MNRGPSDSPRWTKPLQILTSAEFAALILIHCSPLCEHTQIYCAMMFEQDCIKELEYVFNLLEIVSVYKRICLRSNQQLEMSENRF